MMNGAAVSSGSPEMKHWRRKYFGRRCPFASQVHRPRERVQPVEHGTDPAGTGLQDPRRATRGKRSSVPSAMNEISACWTMGAQPDHAREAAALGWPVEDAGGRPVRVERRMDGDRDVEFHAFPEQHVVVRMAVDHPVVVERVHPATLAAVAHGAFEFGGRALRVEERQHGDGYQPTAAVAAEVRDPAVVGARVGETDLGVGLLHFPKQANGWIEQRADQVLLVHQLQTVCGIAGPEGHAVGIAAIRARFQILRAHGPHDAERTLAGTLRRLAVDLEVLEAVVIDADP